MLCGSCGVEIVEAVSCSSCGGETPYSPVHWRWKSPEARLTVTAQPGHLGSSWSITVDNVATSHQLLLSRLEDEATSQAEGKERQRQQALEEERRRELERLRGSKKMDF